MRKCSKNALTVLYLLTVSLACKFLKTGNKN